AGYCQRVKRVIDGDTFILETGERVRLAEVDCPESTQPFGPEAKYFTSLYVLGKYVELDRRQKDIHGRTIAEVYVKGEWLNKLLVINGLAWVYKFPNSEYLYSLE